MLRANPLPKKNLFSTCRRFFSAKDHHHEQTHVEEKIERQFDSYRFVF